MALSGTELGELQAWYRRHCDGDWEHGAGIQIESLDNPGWRVRINLVDTQLDGQPFDVVEERYGQETEWVRCWVAEDQFHGAGGPEQLSRLLRIFLDWARRRSAESPPAAG